MRNGSRDLTSSGDDALTGRRRRTDYTAAEQELSRLLQVRLLELLDGRRNRLYLLRKYSREPDRLGVPAMPRDFPREDLRLPVVEQLARDALDFVRADATGGPISQEAVANGSVLEFQTFPTMYPHVLIERVDRYVDDDLEPVETTWCLHRIQNQRRQVEINRLIDVANLALELLRAFR